jgi:hypothetical protein
LKLKKKKKDSHAFYLAEERKEGKKMTIGNNPTTTSSRVTPCERGLNGASKETTKGQVYCQVVLQPSGFIRVVLMAETPPTH